MTTNDAQKTFLKAASFKQPLVQREIAAAVAAEREGRDASTRFADGGLTVMESARYAAQRAIEREAEVDVPDGYIESIENYGAEK